MDEINKKSPFKVPDGYFDHFGDRAIDVEYFHIIIFNPILIYKSVN